MPSWVAGADWNQYHDQRCAHQPDLQPDVGVSGQRLSGLPGEHQRDIYSSEKSITNYFDKANITVPTEVSKPFGNAGRNIGRSHAFYQLDIGPATRISSSSAKRTS